MVKRSREEPCPICHHWHDYEGGEPCSTCGHTKADVQLAPHDAAQPTEVLPKFLYLGSYDHASRSELLKVMDITHILNVVPSCQNLYKNSFTYFVPTSVPADFVSCFEFLDGVKAADARVLVHCMTGVSKSASVVIGYLMHERRWRLQEAFKWVCDRRPTVKLSPEESKRLQELEVAMLGSSSTGYQQGSVQLQADTFERAVKVASSADSTLPSFAGPQQGPFSWTAWSASAPAVQNSGLLPGQNISILQGGQQPSGPFVFGAH